MNTSSHHDDRRRGALLGLAWGDAFGCPMEGWRAPEIKRLFGDCRVLPPSWPPAARGLPLKVRKRFRAFGSHSDDTQQAIALIGACFDPSGAIRWDVVRWAEWLVEGFESGAWRGFGRNFVSAVHRLRKGAAPGHAGSPSAGIGAAMRIGPLGALLSGDALVEAAFASSLVTHGDVRAGAIAYATALAVRSLIDGHDAATVRAMLPDAVESAETRWCAPDPDWTHDRLGQHQVSAGLRAVFGGPLSDPGALRVHIADVARPHLAAGFTRAHPNQGFALLGGAHALAMALRDDADPNETLAEIVRQGFDTDTVAAIAGTVLGARFGTAWIPTERLLDGSRLDRWADALATGGPAPESRAAFMVAEAALSHAERVFQAEWMAERRTGRVQEGAPEIAD